MTRFTLHNAQSEPETSNESAKTYLRQAFVIMPFVEAKASRRSKKKYATRTKLDLEQLYEQIEGFLLRSHYKTIRVDKEVVGNINEEIVKRIIECDVVISVLTGLNPNVMYELGIAHAFRKKTILLTEDRTELPFDLSNYNCLEYDFSSKTYGQAERKEKSSSLRQELEQAIERIERNEKASFGPIQTHLELSDFAVSRVEKRTILRRLKAVELDMQSKIGRMYEYFVGILREHPQLLCEKDGKQHLLTDVFAYKDIMNEEIFSSSIRIYRSYVGQSRTVELLLADDYILPQYISQEEREALNAACQGIDHLLRDRILTNVVFDSYMTLVLCTYVWHAAVVVQRRIDRNIDAYKHTWIKMTNETLGRLSTLDSLPIKTYTENNLTKVKLDMDVIVWVLGESAGRSRE